MSTSAIEARRSKSLTRLGAQAMRERVSPSQAFWLGVVLLVLTLIVYFPVVDHPFINFDDPVYVVNNPHIASGLTWETIAWSFSTFYQFNWHPLTWLSHALDLQMFHLHAGGHHVSNLLLHALNVLLLYLLLMIATRHVGRSAMVAALFALHPVNVETVAWIAERKNLLSMFFFVLGLGAYRWYVSEPIAKRKGKQVEYEPDLLKYALMTALFTLGLMAKPHIITFPLLLLLWDYWPLGRMASSESEIVSGTLCEPLLPARSFWWLVKEKLPLFAICAVSATVTVVAQRTGGAMASLQHYPVSVRLTNAIVSYARYIGKAFWPVRLAPLYPHPWHALPPGHVIAALLGLLAVTAAVIAARSQRYLLVGWLWFLVSLAPMIGLVQVGNQAMADRYAYLPYVGLFIMVCWSASEVAETVHAPVLVLRAACALGLLALLIVTDHQLAYWANNEALWQHTLAVTEGNYIAHDNLAQLLMEEGKSDEAMKHYQAALDIYPADPNATLGLAVYDHQHGNFSEAIARYEHLISTTPPGPTRAEMLSSEGLVYLDMRDHEKAHASFAAAVDMDPQNVRGWLGLGVVAEASSDWNAAVYDYDRATSLRQLKVAYLMLARALEKSGSLAAAQVARERAKLLPWDEKTTQTFSGGILQK